jgi:SAM-dependent methyltransferase
MGYEEYASDLSSFYETREPVFARTLAESLEEGASVLDIGCGSGRDLAMLRSRGFRAFGLEPSPAMRAEAVRAHPELADRIFEGGLPELRLPISALSGGFDAVFCNASLQHLQPGDLIPAFARIKEALRPGGWFAFSVPLRYPVDSQGIDEKGRYYHLRPRGFWIDLVRRFGFDIRRDASAAESGRPDRTWLQVLCRKSASGGRGPLESIERTRTANPAQAAGGERWAPSSKGK